MQPQANGHDSPLSIAYTCRVIRERMALRRPIEPFSYLFFFGFYGDGICENSPWLIPASNSQTLPGKTAQTDSNLAFY